MNPDLITRLEEHVIALQDADVANGNTINRDTIALLREAKDELYELDVREQELDERAAELTARDEALDERARNTAL